MQPQSHQIRWKTRLKPRQSPHRSTRRPRSRLRTLRRLRGAALPADFDNMVENVLTIAFAEHAQGIVGGVRGVHRAQRKQNEPKEKSCFHRAHDETE